MSTVPNQHGLHFPDYTDSPDVPKDLSLLAKDIADLIDANPGPQGEVGPANSLDVIATNTITAGLNASVTISGTAPSQHLTFNIPKGQDGVLGGPGPSNVLTIGSVTSGATASASITGTSPTQTLNLVLPIGPAGATGATGSQGLKGDAAATIAVNSTTTGAAGTNASVTNSGTSSNVLLNFTIPRGATGATGAQGPQGPTGVDGATPSIDPISLRIGLMSPNTSSTGVNSNWYPFSTNLYSLGKDTSDGGPARYWKDIFSNGTIRAASVIATGNMYINTSTVVTSDENLKNTIDPSNLGLNFINLLNPVSYKFNVGGINYSVDEDGNQVETAVPGNRTHYGLIAQEVKESLDSLNIEDFGGWVQKEDQTQALRYEEFIAPLIKAVQELSARVQALEEK